MKSLDERMRAVDGGLWCPYTDSDLVVDSCIAEFCVHYNPDTHECVHVEAAMAQVRMAKTMAFISVALEHLLSGDVCMPRSLCQDIWDEL